MAITHSKVSAKADGGDSSLVLPSDWNAAHTAPNEHVNTQVGHNAWHGDASVAAHHGQAHAVDSGSDHSAGTLGDVIYAAVAGAWARLTGNTTTTRKFLRQTGTGAASAAPAWDTIADADVPATHSGSAHHAQSHDHSAAGDGQTLVPVTIGNNGSITWNGRVLLDKGIDIASAATLTPGTDGNYFHVTGTTGITAIASLQAGTIVVFEFDGALTITHNATSLILQGAANLTTAAGDVVAFVSEGAGNWRELFRRLAAATVSGISVYARNTTAQAINGSTAETTLFSTTITANDLSTNKMLRITLRGDFLNNSGGNRNTTLRLKFGAMTMTAAFNTNATSATRRTWKFESVLANIGATNVQHAFSEAWLDAAATGTPSKIVQTMDTGTVDTTANVTLSLTAQNSDIDATLETKFLEAIIELV